MISYAFLTKSPNDELIKFANELYDTHKYDIYIIVDDDNYLIKNYNPNLNFIKINVLKKALFTLLNVVFMKLTVILKINS